MGVSRLAQYQRMIWLSQWPAIRNCISLAALNHVLDNESLFADYCKWLNLPLIAVANGLRIKTENTIIEKWPMMLRLKKGEPGFDEEFNALFSSDVWGTETYLEWARAV